jgi:hypothetical protein
VTDLVEHPTLGWGETDPFGLILSREKTPELTVMWKYPAKNRDELAENSTREKSQAFDGGNLDTQKLARIGNSKNMKNWDQLFRDRMARKIESPSDSR